MALIFAVDDYDHPDLQRLSAPIADATALAETLGRAELGGFAVEICHNATSAATAERMEDFLIERQRGDLALLHFSGHGLKDESGGLYLAASNTVPTRLASTAVDTSLINMLMRRSRARSIVLLLDCCYGGAFERGMTARAGGDVAVREQFSQESLGGGRGRVVITASSAVQYAFEGTALADPQKSVIPSLFTSAVVAGIQTGEADRDADGLISLGELYDYVYQKVSEQTPHQTPSKWEYGLEGDLVIAKSPRRTVRPADLPAPLVEVIAHPYPVVRRGAVEELARLANGSDLPMALASLGTLRGLCEDDSRSVASAAIAAVDAMGVTAAPPALDFGERAVGAGPAELDCELTGPPLVETARATVAAPFAAIVDGRIVRVRLDVSAPGDFAGTVSVHSPVGEVAIPVIAAVRPDVTPVVAAPPAVVQTGQPADRPDPATAPARIARDTFTLAPALAAAGGILIGIALFLPWASDAFGGTSLWDSTPVPGILEFQPCLIAVVAAALLMARRGLGIAVGGLLGTGWSSLALLLLVAMIRPTDSGGTWYGGVLVQVGGVALTLTAGVLAVRSVPDLRTAVRFRSDWRSFAGVLVVLVGLTVVFAQLLVLPGSERWMWVFPVAVAIVAVPIPRLSFGRSQQIAALTLITTVVVPWVDGLPWLVADGAFPGVGTQDWWTLCLPLVLVMAGCFLGQPLRPEAGTAAGILAERPNG